MMEMGYDSADKDATIPPMLQGSSPLVFLGETFSVLLTPQGQVQEVKGLDRLQENIAKKVPEGPRKQQMLQNLTGKQLTESIKEFFLRPLTCYPDKPVGIGDTWTRKEVPAIAPYDYDTTWTLKDRKAGIATIEALSTVKPKPQPDQQGPAFSGQFHARIELNESTGQIIRATTTQGLSGNVQAGTSSVSVKTVGVSTVEMTERKGNDDR